jgi:hypothetical protein
MIYLDCNGKLRVDESSSIQEQSYTIFTPEVRRNFLEILGKYIGYHASDYRTSWFQPLSLIIYANTNMQRQRIPLPIG